MDTDSKSSILEQHKGITFIINKVIENKNFLLYFISPEVDIKAKVVSSLLSKGYLSFNTEKLDLLKLLALDASNEELLRKIDIRSLTDNISEASLLYIYVYYAINKNLPQGIVDLLVKSINTKQNNERLDFLINLILAFYFLQDNNLDMTDTHIKFCIEYINFHYADDEYESMITYIVCGKYLEKANDIFISNSNNYYQLAAEIAERLDDKITLAAALSYLSYYYHNVEQRDKSIEYAEKALKAAEELDNANLLFTANKIMSIILQTTGNYSLASTYMEKTIKLSEQIVNFSVIENVKLKNSLGYIYYLKGMSKEALDIHLQALKTLAFVPCVSDILDESVKTFDNLTIAFKQLGDINKAIYFAKLTITLIKNTNYGNRISDIQNLCKLYTELGILYGIFLGDYENAKIYYEHAKLCINKHDHYIKKSNLKMLESYIYCAQGNATLARSCFEESLKLFTSFEANNIYIVSLLICYYCYFYKFFGENYLKEAACLAAKFDLENYFLFYSDFFRAPKITDCSLDDRQYPLNLIMLLSEERKHSLSESKKAKDFELIQDFSNKINLILSEDKLYEEAQLLFNKYFLSKGLAVIKQNLKNGFETKLKLRSDPSLNKEQIKGYLEDFIIKNNLALNSQNKNFDVYSFSNEEGSKKLLKSFIIYYFYDETLFSNYYYIIFTDKKANWIFTEEDALVGSILMKNLFLKAKTVQYTESVKFNSLLDYSTGVYNSQYMWSKLDKTVLIPFSTPIFSMAIMDLNGFKEINDTYGHTIGDEVIKYFAKLLRLSLPEEDIIRYGGDEFVILFPFTSKEAAEKHINKVKQICKTQPYINNNSAIYLDFAYGLDSYIGDNVTSKFFFNKVDNLMYINKHKVKGSKD